MADFTWKQGDAGPAIIDQLSFDPGSGIPNFLGCTIKLRFRSLQSAAALALTGVAEFLDTQGSVQFTPSIADTSLPVGNYIAEWVVTDSLGNPQTFPTDGYLWGTIEPTAATAPQLIVALPTVKKYLNIQENDRGRDAELIDLIDSISPLVEAVVGPVVPKMYDEWYDGGIPTISLYHDPSTGFGSNPYLRVIAASEYRGPIEYPLALVASPAFGSIYSIMVVDEYSSITRRSAGGRTVPFFPGRETVHVWYESGQNPIPKVLQRMTMEFVRTLYRFPQQTGMGSLSPADRMELGAVFQGELSRIVRTWAAPMRRYPAIG